jgi:hypothetical protein
VLNNWTRKILAMPKSQMVSNECSQVHLVRYRVARDKESLLPISVKDFLMVQDGSGKTRFAHSACTQNSYPGRSLPKEF